MGEVDKHGVLQDDIFEYQVTKDRRVRLFWHNKHIKTLAGKQAEKFLAQIEELEGVEAQLLMAKVTGNFKRGNER